MAKSTVQAVINEIKSISDYNITDLTLDDLILKSIKRNLQVLKQLMMKEGLSKDVTATAIFKTVEDQEYIDLLNARIVGNVATFTAVAGDKITVTIDGTAYTTAALTGAVLVATVVTAINLATAAIGDVASESDDGYLVITSPTSGATSSVVIADNAGTPATRLFTVAAERTQSAISNVDEIIFLSERTNDSPIEIIPFHIYRRNMIDPSTDTSTSPLQASQNENYIYFRPRPTSNIYIYIDYYIDVAAITTTSNMPYKDKYDPVIVAMSKKDLLVYLKRDAVQLKMANDEIEYMISLLVTNAANNIAEERQIGSRYDTEPYFAPRKPTEMGT